jgi:hypothetical protein
MPSLHSELSSPQDVFEIQGKFPENVEDFNSFADLWPDNSVKCSNDRAL